MATEARGSSPEPADWRVVCQNVRAMPVSSAVLAVAAAWGVYMHIPWGRTRWEDSLPLLALLLLAAYDQYRVPMRSAPSPAARLASWGCVGFAAIAVVAVGALGNGFSNLLQQSCTLLCLGLAMILRKDGLTAAGRLWPLLGLSVLLPLYEYFLLEASYPLRLLSTTVSAGLLRIFSLGVSQDGTTLLWRDVVFSITDACSGIALLGLLILVEYMVGRSIRVSAWKKWCWGSLLLLWIVLGNALRLLVTLLLYCSFGERVLEKTPHYLLGCLFVMTTSLLIWGSSLLFQLDNSTEAGK